MNIEINECPFCGSDDLEIKYIEFHNKYAVYCEKCKARGPVKNTSTSSAIAWNERDK